MTLPILASDAAYVNPDESELHVVFKVNGAEYALPAATVVQMESFDGATAVPGAEPYLIGVVQIRGRVVPVVDLRVRFGGGATAPVLDNRIVVGQHGERIVGLLVDSAREVVRIKRAELKPPPALLEHASERYVTAVAQLGSRLVLIVDFAKVIGEEQLDVVA
jgi:purine-binding chemotaxis protein CheW